MPSNDVIARARFVLGTAVAAVLLGPLACAGAHAPRMPPTTRRTVSMQEFAFLFRPTRSLESDELLRRNAAAREWALARRREGLLVGASPLSDEGVKVAYGAVSGLSDAHAVGAVLVVQASGLEAAVALAQGHPGLAFGTEIEVRPVKAVTPPTP
jgi:hypothetical protein